MRSLSQATSIRILIALGLFLCAAGLSAKEYVVEPYNYFFDTPEGWGALDDSNGEDYISMSDPDEGVYFQILTFKDSRYKTGTEMAKDIQKKMGSSGELGAFDYYGRSAAILELNFQNAQKTKFKGYAACIAGEKATDPDYLVMSYSAVSDWEYYSAFVASAIDSFSIDSGHRLYPGPVTLYITPYPSPKRVDRQIDFLGQKLVMQVSTEEVTDAQDLVEQEYRVLKTYVEDQKNGEEAWYRFYRMIYRANYHRFDSIAFQIGRELDRKALSGRNAAQAILSWFQTLNYKRDTQGADFLNPLSVMTTHAGDCDSASLAMVIILHHLNIDAILMLSSKYSHAMVGIDVEGAGARFAFDGENWLVAETTDKVDIGLIAADVSNPEYWTAIRFISINPEEKLKARKG